MKIHICVLLCAFIVTVISSSAKGLAESITNNSILRGISRVYEQCENSDDIVRCFKIQGAKIAGRALKVHNIKLLDGISIVKRPGYIENSMRRSAIDQKINNNELGDLSSKSLDNVFYERLQQLFNSHQLQINLPRLMKFGKEQTAFLMEEARGKKDKGGQKYLAPFLAAVFLKAAMMKMAFHSIALIAGKALIVGKIALIISAIIGLKKLVSSEGHEKTTYEIVKHPHIQQSHTYSSSHGEYDGHEGGGGSYHRSIADDEMLMSDKAYRAHIPRS